MKLPSSPLIVYFTIYSSLLFQLIILHCILQPYISSPLVRIFLIDFYITCILFFLGNFIFSSNNIYDLHWPLIPFICSIYFYFTLSFFSWKCLPLNLIIFLWSVHLIWQTVTSSNDIHHEDWRYQKMRKQYENNFLIFSFFALHLLPMFEVLFGSSSIYYIYRNTHLHKNLTIGYIFFFLFICSGVLLENRADKQLKEFRHYKQKSKQHKFSVLTNGLWKYSRHPNYLGELIYWWGLFFLGYISNAPLWCGLGPLLITLMMIFGSIPITEERLFRKYPEYKFVQQRISMLIPTFGLLE